MVILPENEENVKRKKESPRKTTMLVEFMAPMQLVESFDSKSRLRFSSRSEALRYLMRIYLGEPDKVRERANRGV